MSAIFTVCTLCQNLMKRVLTFDDKNIPTKVVKQLTMSLTLVLKDNVTECIVKESLYIPLTPGGPICPICPGAPVSPFSPGNPGGPGGPNTGAPRR